MPEGEQDHRRIPVPVAIALGCRDQLGDLGFRQMFPRPQFGIRAPTRRDCSIYDVQRDQLQARLAARCQATRFETVSLIHI